MPGGWSGVGIHVKGLTLTMDRAPYIYQVKYYLERNRSGSSLKNKDDYKSMMWLCSLAPAFTGQMCEFSSVPQSCPTPCDPMGCSPPGLPVHHNSHSLLKLMSMELVMPSNHLILCCPLLLLPSIFPSIRVSSNESVLPIRWPKYWIFSFSISLSNEYSGLISFRMDWFDLLAVQGVFSNTTV